MPMRPRPELDAAENCLFLPPNEETIAWQPPGSLLGGGIGRGSRTAAFQARQTQRDGSGDCFLQKASNMKRLVGKLKAEAKVR